MIPSVVRHRLPLLSEFQNITAYLDAFHAEPCCRGGVRCGNCLAPIPGRSYFCSAACLEALALQHRILRAGPQRA